MHRPEQPQRCRHVREENKTPEIEKKLEHLTGIVRDMGSVVLAYSGGLDSTLLLKVLERSGARALAVTSSSPTTPGHDLSDAVRLAGELGVEHRVISTSEMQDENFTRNSPDRCYYCKDELFGKLAAIARDEGYACVIDGTNLDDQDDHRPGTRAAEEHGVRSPLREAGFTKRDIREASKSLGLSTWSKPSSACLSSRIPYGTPITAEALGRVREAEGFLRALGFDALRVRDHAGIARIEVPLEEHGAVLQRGGEIVSRLRALGYKFVCLDLEGITTGSMNRLVR